MDLLLIISSLVLWIEKFYCCWFQTSGETRPTQSIESWNLITGRVLPRQGGNLLISSCQHIRNYYGERHSTWCSLLSWVGREGKEENSWILYTISLKVSLHYADPLNAVESKLDHDMGTSKTSFSKKWLQVYVGV